MMKKLYKNYDIRSLDINYPPLFSEIYAIHSKINSNALSNILSKSQTMDLTEFKTEDDLWIGFVTKYSKETNLYLSKYLGNILPIPVNLTLFLSDLHYLIFH